MRKGESSHLFFFSKKAQQKIARFVSKEVAFGRFVCFFFYYFSMWEISEKKSKQIQKLQESILISDKSAKITEIKTDERH